ILYTHKINSLNSRDVYLVNKKESYQATWLDLVMETRPEQQTTLFENGSSRKETYKQKQVAHFLVQINSSQRIKMGTRGGMLNKAASPKDLYRSPSPSEYKSIMEFEMIAKEVCSDKQEIFEITKDLPKVSQPIRVNFRASSLISHSFRG
uniref:Uncharacterized protein n=1 Tax=Salmo trutta TaxID=8032 RepID=A0A674A8K6_SALTR